MLAAALGVSRGRGFNLDSLGEIKVERSFDPIDVSRPHDRVLSSNGDVMASPEVTHSCWVYVLECEGVFLRPVYDEAEQFVLTPVALRTPPATAVVGTRYRFG